VYVGLYKILFCLWFMGLCAQINTILCAPTLCVSTPPHTSIARTIAKYNVCLRPPVIEIYTTQSWQLQYRVKANVYARLPVAGCLHVCIHSRLYTKRTLVRTYRVLIREWLWEPTRNSLEFI